MVLTAGQDKNKIRRGEDSVKQFREGLCPAGISRMTHAIWVRTHERDARAYI